MNAVSESVEELLHASVPAGGVIVSGGRALFMEVMDTTNRSVWMSAAAVQPADFESLTLEEPFIKSGIGLAAMDGAAFQHSPGTPDQAVRERLIDGHRFINVATPSAMIAPTQPSGPMELMVDKGHVLGFAAGRTVSVLTLPDGDFIEVVGDASEDDARVLPMDGTMKEIVLTEPWVVPLPTPTRAFFWSGKSMRSFQGPVALPGSGTTESG